MCERDSCQIIDDGISRKPITITAVINANAKTITKTKTKCKCQNNFNVIQMMQKQQKQNLKRKQKSSKLQGDDDKNNKLQKPIEIELNANIKKNKKNIKMSQIHMQSQTEIQPQHQLNSNPQPLPTSNQQHGTFQHLPKMRQPPFISSSPNNASNYNHPNIYNLNISSDSISTTSTSSDDSSYNTPDTRSSALRASGPTTGGATTATKPLGVNLRVTGQCSQGGRKYMEDYFSVAYQQADNAKDLEYAFIGIYDGHGGAEAATFAKEHLMMQIINQKLFWSDSDKDVMKAIRQGYIATHYAMWAEQGNWPKTPNGLPSTAGTTATIAFIRREKLYIGHVGDSGVVLGYQHGSERGWRAKQLTTDHKPESMEERARITRSGGKVIVKSGVPRVVWNRPRDSHHKGPIRYNTPIDEIPFLAVARSLGDLWSYNYVRNEFIVSPDPDVKVVKIDPKTFKCLIFGTDGLWNVVTAQEAVDTVYEKEMINEYVKQQTGFENSEDGTGTSTSNGTKWMNPSKSLVDRALRTWSARKLRADNTSVVTVILYPPGQMSFSDKRSSTANACFNNPLPAIDLIDNSFRNNNYMEYTLQSDADSYHELIQKYLPPKEYRDFNYYGNDNSTVSDLLQQHQDGITNQKSLTAEEKEWIEAVILGHNQQEEKNFCGSLSNDLTELRVSDVNCQPMTVNHQGCNELWSWHEKTMATTSLATIKATDSDKDLLYCDALNDLDDDGDADADIDGDADVAGDEDGDDDVVDDDMEPSFFLSCEDADETSEECYVGESEIDQHTSKSKASTMGSGSTSDTAAATTSVDNIMMHYITDNAASSSSSNSLLCSSLSHSEDVTLQDATLEDEEKSSSTFVSTFTDSYSTILNEQITVEDASTSNSNTVYQTLSGRSMHEILQEQQLYQEQCMSQEDGYSLTKLETRREQRCGGVQTFKIFQNTRNQNNQNDSLLTNTNCLQQQQQQGQQRQQQQLHGRQQHHSIVNDIESLANSNDAADQGHFWDRYHAAPSAGFNKFFSYQKQQQQPNQQKAEEKEEAQQHQKPLEIDSLLQQEREEEQQVAFERLERERKLALTNNTKHDVINESSASSYAYNSFALDQPSTLPHLPPPPSSPPPSSPPPSSPSSKQQQQQQNSQQMPSFDSNSNSDEDLDSIIEEYLEDEVEENDEEENLVVNQEDEEHIQSRTGQQQQQQQHDLETVQINEISSSSLSNIETIDSETELPESIEDEEENDVQSMTNNCGDSNIIEKIEKIEILNSPVYVIDADSHKPIPISLRSAPYPRRIPKIKRVTDIQTHPYPIRASSACIAKLRQAAKASTSAGIDRRTAPMESRSQQKPLTTKTTPLFLTSCSKQSQSHPQAQTQQQQQQRSLGQLHYINVPNENRRQNTKLLHNYDKMPALRRLQSRSRTDIYRTESIVATEEYKKRNSAINLNEKRQLRSSSSTLLNPTIDYSKSTLRTQNSLGKEMKSKSRLTTNSKRNMTTNQQEQIFRAAAKKLLNSGVIDNYVRTCEFNKGNRNDSRSNLNNTRNASHSRRSVRKENPHLPQASSILLEDETAVPALNLRSRQIRIGRISPVKSVASVTMDLLGLNGSTTQVQMPRRELRNLRSMPHRVISVPTSASGQAKRINGESRNGAATSNSNSSLNNNNNNNNLTRRNSKIIRHLQLSNNSILSTPNSAKIVNSRSLVKAAVAAAATTRARTLLARHKATQLSETALSTRSTSYVKGTEFMNGGGSVGSGGNERTSGDIVANGTHFKTDYQRSMVVQRSVDKLNEMSSLQLRSARTVKRSNN